MDVTILQHSYSDLYLSLFDEGILNQQFKELENLQDENDPMFVFQTFSLFTKSTKKLINDIRSYINQPTVNYLKMKELLHRLKGSSQFIGAQRIETACANVRKGCDENNLQECLTYIEPLNEEFLKFKNKLETLFDLEKQIVAAGGSIPKMH